jgi:hypothetical protein
MEDGMLAIQHDLAANIYVRSKDTQRHKDESGSVPRWFLAIFDFLLWKMWLYHDFLLAPIFGRGDGR